jgi:membrane-bound serine protease (ClpP class)
MTTLTELIQSLGADPIYVVLLAGIWLAITAVYVPGTGIPEVGALLSLLVAVGGILVFPVSLLGVALLVVGMACILAMVAYRHLWPLLIAGFVFQIAGSFLLFRGEARPGVATILIVMAAAVAYHQLMLLPGLRIQDRRSLVDADSLIGLHARVESTIDPSGIVRVEGEAWSADADELIEAGRTVRIVGREGLHLKVVPTDGERS